MSDDFQRRLESAIQRGQRRKEVNEQANRLKAMNEEEAKRLHSSLRLALSDRIANQMEQLALHFPGFRKETLFGEAGWGAACYRDDLAFTSGRRSSKYSRLEITVRPYNEYQVLDLRAKGTVQNKEVFNRNFFETLQQVDPQHFENLIDTWVVEYAEQYAASQ
jgi:hypothetical protein